MNLTGCRYIIIGSGIFGSVLAERIANGLGEKVVVFEKRKNTGGNCYSETDPETGIEYHKYGPHIFHTSIERVWKYINRFVSFNSYRHQVLTVYNNQVYQMPINLKTINSFYGLNLAPYEAEQFLKREIAKDAVPEPRNFQEKAISKIGRPLYEAFIKGYTQKQWQHEPEDLPVEILDRLPFRTDYNESYYHDRWQGIPEEEYSILFSKLLSSKKITVLKDTDYFKIKRHIPKGAKLIYTGPIDRYYQYNFGKLEWRSLDFKKEVVGVKDFQGTPQMNYAELSVPYTRIIEPRHFHPERNYSSDKTVIIKEYPVTNADEPYYPVNDARNQKLYNMYYDLARQEKSVIFGGRLGEYKYLDMDKVIESALALYNKLKEGLSN